MSTTSIDILVREGLGTYQTSTVKKMRASCTVGPSQAAMRLGEKLFGLSSLHKVEPLAGDCPMGTTRWRLTARECFAWCWQSGLIQVGAEVPEGSIAFAKGMSRPLVEVLHVTARHAYRNAAGERNLLVPGVPEAEEGDPKVDALIRWIDWCAKSNGNTSREGVIFGRNL